MQRLLAAVLGLLALLCTINGGAAVQAKPESTGATPSALRTLAYVAEGGLRIIDVTDPNSPRQIGAWDDTSPPMGSFGGKIVVAGNYAYMVGQDGLVAINVTDPTNPYATYKIISSTTYQTIAVQGAYAYVGYGDYFRGLKAYSLNNPAAPQQTADVDSYYGGGTVTGIAIAPPYLYAADWGLKIFDIHNPGTPSIVSSSFQTLGSQDVAVALPYAYVTGNGLHVINVSNPQGPVQEGVATDVASGRVKLAGRFAYIMDGRNGIDVVDVANAAHPSKVIDVPLAGETRDVFVLGNYVYAAAKDAGLHIVDITSPTTPIVRGSLPTSGWANGVFVEQRQVTLPTYTISGRVTDESGGPLGDVRLDLTAPSGDTVKTITSASDGSYHFTDVEPGAYTVWASKAGYAWSVSDDVTVPPSANDVNLVLHPGYTISGRITDASGAGMPHISYIYSGSGAADAKTGPDATQGGGGATDENGYYRTLYLRSGSWTITPSKDGYTFSPSSRAVQLPPDQTGQDFVGRPVSPTLSPLVFLPGIMGTKLSDDPQGQCINDNPTNIRELWPNISGLLTELGESPAVWPHVPRIPRYNQNLQKLRLLVDGHTPAQQVHIQPCGIVDRVKLGIPPISVDKDIYWTFLSRLAQDTHRQVYSAGYDWRLDIVTSAALLDRYVDQVRQETGAPQVILVGHSMGGLVAREYTADPQRAAKVEKVISVGSPYWGAPLLAKHMRDGSTDFPFDVLLDKNAIRDIIRNSPGALELLPWEDFVQQSQGVPYFMDDNHPLTSYQDMLEFFTNAGQNVDLLQAAHSFHRRLDDFSRNMNVPYYVLAAKTRRTVALVREYPCAFFGRCWSEEAYAAGDGTVPWRSARLYGTAGDWRGNATVCTYAALADPSADHAGLMHDTWVIEDVEHILSGDDMHLHCAKGQTAGKTDDVPAPFVQIAVTGSGRMVARDAEGRLTGVNDAGIIVNQIPDSSYREDQAGATLVLPATVTYTVTLGATQDGPLQLRVSDFSAPSAADVLKPRARAIFAEIPATTDQRASITVGALLDLPGLRLAFASNPGGTPGAILTPSSVVDEQGADDYTHPTTTVSVQGEHDTLGFYTGPVVVTLSATDVGSGVLRTEYSVDGGRTWQLYSTPVSLVAEQTAVFSARSLDRAGNEEYPAVSQRLRPFGIFLPLLQKDPAPGDTGEPTSVPHPPATRTPTPVRTPDATPTPTSTLTSTPRATPTPTSTLTSTPRVMLTPTPTLTSTPIPAGRIDGQLLADGAPAPGQAVTLQRYNSTTNEVVLTTTTTITGYYQFVNPPVLAQGDKYDVFFGPNLSHPEYVFAWFGPDIVSYVAGQTASGGVLNIADAPLLSPADGATLIFPATLTWRRRTTTTDSYHVVLYDPTARTVLWRSDALGYQDSLTLRSIADVPNLELGKTYLWWLEITDSTTNGNSSGLSYGDWRVSFTQPAALTPTPTRTATMTPTATPTPTLTPTTTSTSIVSTKFLVFASTRDGTRDIYRYDFALARITRLTNDASFDGWPAASPNGERMCFESNRTGNMSIWCTDRDGNHPTNLTGSVGISGMPRFSPNGQLIAYHYAPPGQGFQLWVMNADGTDKRQVTHEAGYVGEPAWFPDGQKLVFDADAPDRNILKINLDGTGRTVVNSRPGQQRSPSVSPDGQYTYYDSNEEGTFQIYRMRPDGREPTRFTTGPGENYFPQISSSGTELVFVSTRDGQAEELYISPAAQSNPQRITTSVGMDSEPSWANTYPCSPLSTTSSFSNYWGRLNLDGEAVDRGALVEAFSPRGDRVGCFQVISSGMYGVMRVFGEDRSVVPSIPGMRPGEQVRFQVGSTPVRPSVCPLNWQDDKLNHWIDLTGPDECPR